MRLAVAIQYDTWVPSRVSLYSGELQRDAEMNAAISPKVLIDACTLTRAYFAHYKSSVFVESTPRFKGKSESLYTRYATSYERGGEESNGLIVVPRRL